MALPIEPPVKPMLARPVKRIPDSGELLFEPKWDGFRCLVFRDGDDLTLQSRAGKPLNRYFPEVLETLRAALPERVVVDGELVVARGGKLDFDALTERVHPAESRVRLLAEQSPASFVAFDLLALDDRAFAEEPTSVRREHLVKLAADGVHITPATTDPATAREWFTLFEGAGLDGVIGKPLDAVYEPNKRIMFKYKHTRTADCVLAGLRWHVDGAEGEAVGSFLLGLHDERGVLHHVGVVGSFPVARRRELAGNWRTSSPRARTRGSGTRRSKASACPAGSPGGGRRSTPGFRCGRSAWSRSPTSTPRAATRRGSGTPPSSCAGGPTANRRRATTPSSTSPRATTSTPCSAARCVRRRRHPLTDLSPQACEGHQQFACRK